MTVHPKAACSLMLASYIISLLFLAIGPQATEAGGKGKGGEGNIIISTGGGQNTKIKIMKVPVPYPVIKHVPYPVPVPIIQKKYIPVEKYIPVYKHHHHEGHHGGHETQQLEQYAAQGAQQVQASASGMQFQNPSPSQSNNQQAMSYLQMLKLAEAGAADAYAASSNPYGTQAAGGYYSNLYTSQQAEPSSPAQPSSLSPENYGYYQQQEASNKPHAQRSIRHKGHEASEEVRKASAQSSIYLWNSNQTGSESVAVPASGKLRTSQANSTAHGTTRLGYPKMGGKLAPGQKLSQLSVAANELMAVSSSPAAHHKAFAEPASQTPAANPEAALWMAGSNRQQQQQQQQQLQQQLLHQAQFQQPIGGRPASQPANPPTMVSLVMPSQQQQQPSSSAPSSSLLASTQVGGHIMQRLRKFTNHFTNSTAQSVAGSTGKLIG